MMSMQKRLTRDVTAFLDALLARNLVRLVQEPRVKIQ